jgi:hypothetical protein
VDAISHHLPALYAIAAMVAIPGVAILLIRYFKKRRERLFREAMLHGNRLHRAWLDQSKDGVES